MLTLPRPALPSKQTGITREALLVTTAPRVEEADVPVLEAATPATAALHARSSIVAAAIRDAFDAYNHAFFAVTRRARLRFEARDWKGRANDDRERMELYERALDGLADTLARILGPLLRDEKLWTEIKASFSPLIEGRYDGERAETFFNSVTRRVFETVGLNREIEFFRWDSAAPSGEALEPIYATFSGDRPSRSLIREVLALPRFAAPFEDLERDCGLVAQEVDLHLWPLVGSEREFELDVIRAPFYRNKMAYLIGRIRASGRHLPLVLPLRNGENGVYVDTVLLSEAEASVVFSFAFSYFHVDVDRHDALIDFLSSILPEKPTAELYFSLGFNRHGKTEFYRDLHKFVHRSREPFVIAPGKEGAVMMVFTLADFPFVFKVIKDRPCFLRSVEQPPKFITKSEIRARYEFVSTRDRAGRLVDTQEFSNLRFRAWRFSPDLLAEFSAAGREAVFTEDDHVVIQHAYVQRRVTPLPIYWQQENDPEALRRVIFDFGNFLKDLAASGIFPLDLFNTWNYGVTRRGRVVLYDYDDVVPLELVTFAEKPRPRDEFEELEPDEERIGAGPGDFFTDEMRRYTGVPQPLKGIFESAHGDLFSLEFWRTTKQRVRAGEVADITPYLRNESFRARLGLH